MQQPGHRLRAYLAVCDGMMQPVQRLCKALEQTWAVSGTRVATAVLPHALMSSVIATLRTIPRDCQSSCFCSRGL